MKKKTIVLIAGTYQLFQALWYYSCYPENEYIAVLKFSEANEDVRSALRKLCEKSGIFSVIYEYSGTTIDSGLSYKVKLMLSMIFCYCTGRRKQLTKKIIREQIGDLKYDQVVVDSELSILGGAFIDHSDETETVIMQEGLSDILKRETKLRRGRGELPAYLLAKMGYCTPAIIYPLPKTKYCKKLTSMEELLQYKDYAEFIPVFSPAGTAKFHEVLDRTYDSKSSAGLMSADVFLFTNPLDKFGGDEKVYEQVHAWLRERCSGKRIVIKKHPRDSYEYRWEDLNIEFIETSLPAELILSQINDGQTMLFMFISTCILDILNRETEYGIFYFSALPDVVYFEKFKDLEKQLSVKEEKIIRL